MSRPSHGRDRELRAAYRPAGTRSAIADAVRTALRSLSICTPILLGPAGAVAQSQDQPTLSASIAAEPLARALGDFARQTGLQLIYVSEIAQDKMSRAVAAGVTGGEALEGMLQGTGLRFDYLTARTVRIELGKAAPRPSTQIGPDIQVSEVVVTANRRVEDLQDVPITVEVMTGAVLEHLNATTFDDYSSNLPTLTAHGIGPGQNNIYVRGLATVEPGGQGTLIGGTFPNVTVYLDEQSVQYPSHNLDIYAADLARIELLEGPQGTLFGAGAQAGVVRYITNKPKLGITEGSVDTGYAWTSHGAPSHSVQAVVNLPVLPDSLAVRGVVYDEKRGGYIDNTPAVFARSNRDVGILYEFGAAGVPKNSVVINNFGIAANDFNPVTYAGGRLETLYQINDHWNALLTLSYQEIEADGVSAEMASNSQGQPLPDLTVQLFNPSFYKDRFRGAALTVAGQIGDLKALYTGGFLVRNLEQVQDYTSYARGGYADYYQCVNPSAATGTVVPGEARCYSPSSRWYDSERNTHQTHEFRLTTPSDWRIRAIGGLFFENYVIREKTDWFYTSAIPYFPSIAPPTGYYMSNGTVVCTCQALPPGAKFYPGDVYVNDPGARPPGDTFFNDLIRSYTQDAAYLSVDWDLVPKTLTLTTGTRYFRIRDSLQGASVGSAGCNLIYFANTPDPCVNQDTANITAEGLQPTYSRFTSRLNLGWKVSDDKLLYYTWSQGFRPGSFNRPVATPSSSPLSAGPPGSDNPAQALARLNGTWQPPRVISPDSLINNEIGWKTMWLGQRLQWDGAIYQEIWSDVQSAVNAPGITPPDVINGGDYRVRGMENTIVARVSSGLSVEGGAVWNHNRLIKEAPYTWANGVLIDFNALHIVNPAGTLGSSLAGAPVFQGHIRVRYEYHFSDYLAFAQAGVIHQSQSLASTDQLRTDLQGNPVDYVLPSWTTYDAALGLQRAGWLAQLYGQNLSDTRAQLYANYRQWYKAVTVNRPMTIGLNLSYHF